MNKSEWNIVWGILQRECYVSASDIEIWAKSIIDLDYADVIRELKQYRECEKYEVKLVPEPNDVRRGAKDYHGYDPIILKTIKEMKK